MSERHFTARTLLTALALTLGTAAVQAAPAVDAPAPDFSIRAEQGQLALSEHKGKVVYLDFWASWCDPCKASFKWLNEMQDRYAGKGLVVVAVNLDQEPEAARKFLKQNPVRFRVGFDPEGKVATQYQLKGMPTSYTVDKAGRLRGTHIGFREKDKAALEAHLLKLLES